MPALGVLGMLGFVVACQFETYVPRQAPRDPDGERRFSGELLLDTPIENEVNCNMGDCRDWLGVRVPAAGSLHLVLQVLGREQPSGIRLILHGPEQALDQTDWSDPPPLRVSGAVVPGVYFALVEGSGERVRFSLLATFEPESQEP
jgi:hypothetical protein